MSHRSSPLLITVGGAVMALSLAMTPIAHASFPGQNGRVLFDSPRSGATRLHSVDPEAVNPPVVLASNGSGEDLAPSGSPDGSRMAFASDRVGPGNGSHFVFVNSASTSIPQPATAPFDTDGATKVTSAPGDDRDPSFVTNTSLVYSHRTGNGPYQLFVVDLTTSATTQVLTSTCNDVEPVASPVNADLIAFTRECPFANAEVWLLDRSQPVSATNPRDLTVINKTPITGNDYDVDQDRNPDWAPNGSRIAVSGVSSTLFGGLFQLFSLSPDGGNRTLFWGESTYPTYAGSGYNDRQPAYSPDSSELVFTRSNPGTGADVFVGLSDLSSLTSASSPTNIAPAAGTDDRPAWLPVMTPPPDIPEAPLTALLPVTGAALIGAGLWVRRRHSSLA